MKVLRSIRRAVDRNLTSRQWPMAMVREEVQFVSIECVIWLVLVTKKQRV